MKEEIKAGEKIGSAKSETLNKIRENPWIASTLFLALVLVVVFLTGGFGLTGGVVASEKAISENIVSFVESQSGKSVEVVSVEKDGQIYEVTVNYEGQEFPVYVTLDGKYLANSVIPLTGNVASVDANPDAGQAASPKSDKPKVELFIMTHCPFGTQAEKGLIPAIKALDDKIDAKIRFVHYFMHGDSEEKETYNQICIREEQPLKFLSYLECFLGSTGSADDSKKCLDSVNIDKTKLDSCIAGKAKDYYAADSKLSQSYGVQGSPTLVINGAQSSAGRDSASYLAGICSAFNKEPSECSTKLSSTSPSSGFGYSGSTADSASCNT